MSNLIVLLWMVGMSVLDIRSKRVPIWLMVGGGMLALAVAFAENFVLLANNQAWWNYAGELAGGMIPGICLLLLGFTTKTVGSGDGVVMILLGALLGWKKCLLVLCVGLFLAALSSLILLALKKVKRNTFLPFIPFLCLGWILMGIY